MGRISPKITYKRRNSRLVVIDGVGELTSVHPCLHFAFVIAASEADFDLLRPDILKIDFEP